MTKIDKELACAFIVLSHCIKILKGMARGIETNKMGRACGAYGGG